MPSINRIPLFTILCLVLLHEVSICWAILPGGVGDMATTALNKGAETIKNGAEELKKTLPLPHFPVLGPQINCKDLCFARCNSAPKYLPCFRDCSNCCQRCNCVPPPGAPSNARNCACWDSMAAQNGRKKCP